MPVVPTENIRPLKWEAQLISNPIKNKLSLRWMTAPEVQTVDLQIANLNGQILHQRTIQGAFTAGTTFFEWHGIKTMPAGAYIIRLLTGNEVQLLRLIKS